MLIQNLRSVELAQHLIFFSYTEHGNMLLNSIHPSGSAFYFFFNLSPSIFHFGDFKNIM